MTVGGVAGSRRIVGGGALLDRLKDAGERVGRAGERREEVGLLLLRSEEGLCAVVAERMIEQYKPLAARDEHRFRKLAACEVVLSHGTQRARWRAQSAHQRTMLTLHLVAQCQAFCDEEHVAVLVGLTDGKRSGACTAQGLGESRRAPAEIGDLRVVQKLNNDARLPGSAAADDERGAWAGVQTRAAAQRELPRVEDHGKLEVVELAVVFGRQHEKEAHKRASKRKELDDKRHGDLIGREFGMHRIPRLSRSIDRGGSPHWEGIARVITGSNGGRAKLPRSLDVLRDLLQIICRGFDRPDSQRSRRLVKLPTLCYGGFPNNEDGSATLSYCAAEQGHRACASCFKEHGACNTICQLMEQPERCVTLGFVCSSQQLQLVK
mmetsp:Transcript_26614/g.77765  ORF Transcript_26614/g.77765 Transcript_26614/m.77765 type:complete len:379 (-) Transcript_26614:2040-3176(-)